MQLPGSVGIGAAPEPVRRLATGVADLDALLGGGLPRGQVSEIVGATGSGRTAVAHALLAAATRRGEVVAVVDLPDALHPETLGRAGAALERVLWVRPPSLLAALKCTELILGAGGFGLVVLDVGAAVPALPLHVWPRLLRAARQAGAVLAVQAPQRVAGSSAALSLALTLQRARWNAGLFEGLAVRAVLARNKLGAPGRAAELRNGF